MVDHYAKAILRAIVTMSARPEATTTIRTASGQISRILFLCVFARRRYGNGQTSKTDPTGGKRKCPDHRWQKETPHPQVAKRNAPPTGGGAKHTQNPC